MTVALGALALAGCGSTGTVTIRPGESFDAAAARAGRDGIVLLPAGDYPAQTVSTGATGDCVSAPTATKDCRVFLAKPGVRIGNLRIEGAGTAFTAGARGDYTIAGAYSLSGARESMIDNAVIDPPDGEPGVYLDHVTDFQLSRSEVKGVLDNDGVDVYGGPTGSLRTRLLDNDIHGVRLSANSCQHTDGIQSAGTSGPGNTGTVIRGNRIYDVDQNADIQLDSAPSQVGTGETVEGNTLGAVNYVTTPCVPKPTPRSLNISGHGLTVRDNSWTVRALVYPGTGIVSGNSGVGTSGACSNYTWSSNQWAAGGC